MGNLFCVCVLGNVGNVVRTRRLGNVVRRTRYNVPSFLANQLRAMKIPEVVLFTHTLYLAYYCPVAWNGYHILLIGYYSCYR